MSGWREFNFNALPEDIFAAIMIILITSPHDAPRYALVSKLFRSAADSDVVWMRFLPPNYQEIIDRSSNCAPRCGACAGCKEIKKLNSLSKKQLCLRLKPLLIDGGRKSFALDKWSGKKIYMIAARSLFIVWGNDARYWAWAHRQDSRFQEVAHLKNVCWLEIQGNINMSLLSPNTTYAAYLVFKMTDDDDGFDCSLEASVGIGGTINTRNVAMFTQEEEHNGGHVIHPVEGHPEQRPDGWFELEIGEFFINGEEDGNVEMALLENKHLDWKSGLVVQGLEIRPKAVRH